MNTRMRTTVGFVLAFVIIVGVLVSSNISTNKFIDDSEWMTHSVEVRAQLEELSTDFLKAQNNIRGYHMTLEENFLNSHMHARAEIKETIHQLRVLTADSDIQKHNLDLIEAAINDKVATWDTSFALRKEKGLAGILDRMRSDKAKTQDSTIFEGLERALSEENRLLAIRTDRSMHQGKTAKLIVGFGGILAALLVAGAAFQVYRDNRRRQVAEANIDQFFTLSLDLLCISGMDGFFKRLSPSFAETLGYSLKELYAKPIVDFVHPADIARTNDEVANQMKGNKVLSFENRFRRKDGAYRTFSWKSVPVGEFMYAAARDVTTQKEREAELMEAREVAQNAAGVKAAFLANMSHEIRTPLNGVVGMTDLLARTELKIEQRSFVTAIRSSATILLNIINEILDFSKIEAGRTKVEVSDFALSHLIEGRISLVGVMAAEKNLQIKTKIDPEIPSVLKGDAVKLGQVLLNFLSNAIKFTERGTVLLTAEAISRTATHCEIRVAVTDSGIGIDPENLKALFEPFMQVDTSNIRKVGGTGLGLSICKRLIEIMGGHIGVESTPNYGSTFWFTVNLETSRLQALAPIDRHPPVREKLSEEQMNRRRNMRILIAEDNRINQVVTMGMLSALGFSANLAENGEQALELYSKANYDMILMDHQMPVMDGIEASTRIRKLEEGTGRRVPIIGFSATVMQDEQKVQFKSLMDDFILKPVTIELLETVLMQWEKRIV